MQALQQQVIIPARNRRQVMDWSLVLASQGIGHRIDHDETAGWTLTVAAADHAAAVHHIRQYRLENRHWRWRRPVFQSGLIFDWCALGWVALVVFFECAAWDRPALRAAGEMRGEALAQGEWWRLFTATWLHADPGHLALNAVFGFLFLGVAMGRYGPGLGWLGAALAGAGGNLASAWAHGAPMRGLGASGVVMGALGLLSFPSFARLKPGGPRMFRPAAGVALAGLLLFVLTGTSPEGDAAAHLGGYVSGCLLGALLAALPRPDAAPRLNLAAGIVSCLLVIVPWWLALHRP